MGVHGLGVADMLYLLNPEHECADEYGQARRHRHAHGTDDGLQCKERNAAVQEVCMLGLAQIAMGSRSTCQYNLRCPVM